ncbi:sensor histidine kinase [Geosporobacter ferrireducens]|uniref:histidine kinase n=1 Tax=Geosporobacter ferrireducens TaxID=1424294 RepID=A0A1D8GE21_9FIRM|nr:ATP-binding protein [Geosporobacter ferrireducens]AOT69163.1 two-component sensor histidine kinase [Geosporobacter ferrireducens]MTI56840.1 HAMP domain-containing protein [Geosporobacter ferrireducens]
MKFGLKAKLSLSNIILVTICVALISIFANIFLEEHFIEYIMQNQEHKIEHVVSLIQDQYEENIGWNQKSITKTGINALEQGLIVKVKDDKDNIIWDAVSYDPVQCENILSHMSENMNSRYPKWQGGYVEKQYPVYFEQEQVGIVEIGYYGPFYYTDNDLHFIRKINRMLISIGTLSLIFALFVGNYMGNRLITPILRVIRTAQMIAKGYFGDRSREKSNTKEINELIRVINDLAETLENQDRLRKKITADVAHELRTPLATLQSHMDAMIEGIWDINVERLKSCNEEISRLINMVGDLQELAKVEGENLILNKVEFDISELVQKMIMNFDKQFKNKQVEIEFFGDKTMVVADKDKISQVIINLMSNALKYTQTGGMAAIWIHNNDEIISLRIKDSGIGISKEDLPHIFERFYRAEKSRNRLTGGSGIGLAIVKAIVEAHKGTIMVRSNLNQGTEFVITLPKQVN